MRISGSMAPERLMAMMRTQPEGAAYERARLALLEHLIEVEVQYRTEHRHNNVGYHQVSSCAGIGEGRGECTGLVDHVGKAALRYRYEHRHRSMAAALLAHIPERQRMAVLITGYVLAPMGDCRSPRMMTLAQACERQVQLLQVLGWPAMAGYGAGAHVVFRPRVWCLEPWVVDRRVVQEAMRSLVSPGAVKPFVSRVALRDASRRGREKLLQVVAQQAQFAA